MSTPMLYTPAEAAKVLSIGRSTLYSLMDSGDLPSIKVGRCRRIRHDQLIAFLDRLAS